MRVTRKHYTLGIALLAGVGLGVVAPPITGPVIMIVAIAGATFTHFRAKKATRKLVLDHLRKDLQDRGAEASEANIRVAAATMLAAAREDSGDNRGLIRALEEVIRNPR